jgi:type VI secretion system protein ImpA
MPSPVTIDFAPLLTPIPGENPAGESLRFHSTNRTYDAIQEARRSDDNLDQGEWVHKIKTSDWPAVIEIATTALATRSKDLQIAAWLVEALVEQYGFAGLRDGLRLLWELQERFWDSLFPTMEEGDLEPRAAALLGLNRQLPPSIRQVPITQGTQGEPYAWLHWKDSREVDNLGRRDQAAMAELLADGKITGEQFDKAVEATPLDYHKTLLGDLDQIWQEYEKLVEVVDEKFGLEAPSLLGMKTAIEDCRTLVTDIVKKKGGLEPEPTPEPTLEPTADPLPQEPRERQPLVGVTVHEAQEPQARSIPRPTVMSLEPQNRADALRRLAAVADYFRRTEPHSPISYLVQRAVRWGEMPLEQWLQDVIHDESVLGYLRETLGLKNSDGELKA